MKLKLSVDQSTSPSELIILGAFFESLALAREGHVVSVPAEDAGDDPTPAETVVVQVPPAAGEEAPKRRRRTKAEIAEAEAKAGPFYWSHLESSSFGIAQTREELDKTLAGDPCCEEVTKEQYLKLVAEASTHAASAIPSHEAAVGNVQPAPTPDATVTDTAPAQAPAEPEPASASPSEPVATKSYTHAEVQALAVDTARRYGPEKVKALIATYPNAAKIAELDEGDLAGFVAKLQAISA